MTSLFLLTVGLISAQTYKSDSISIKNGISKEWTLYESNEQFDIEYKASNCNPRIGYDKEMILLRFTNKTSSKLIVDWHMIMFYNRKCKTCDYFDEYHYSVSVDANSKIEGNCMIESNYMLKMFSKFIDTKYTLGERLTSFELKNINVH